jgi:hypothetical protein
MGTRHWTPLATIALLALLAQPVAVLMGPASSVGAASDDQPEVRCEAPVPADRLDVAAPSMATATDLANHGLRDACATETVERVVEDATDTVEETTGDAPVRR